MVAVTWTLRRRGLDGRRSEFDFDERIQAIQEELSVLNSEAGELASQINQGLIELCQ